MFLSYKRYKQIEHVNRMKFYETHFEEYIHAVNLHPKLEKVFKSFPSKIDDKVSDYKKP